MTKQERMDFIGERIKTLRLGRGLSQSALAERLDVTQQAIDRYEHGLIDVPTSRMVQLAEHLGCTVHDLLPTTQEMPA